MKKILSILMLVAVLATSLMVFPVAAENYDTVYKATPTFDGKLDNVYKSSLTCVMNESFWSGADYILGANGAEYKGDYYDPNFTATTYFLHDDEYVYVCVYVQDANIIDAPASTKKDKEPWPIDGAEVFMELSHGELVAFRTDAFASVKKTKPAGYEDYFEYKAFRGNGYYTIEYRIEKVGLKIANRNGALKVCVQIDDLYSLDQNKPLGIGAGFDLGSTDSATLIYLSKKAATGNATVDTTTKAPVTTPAETTKAPVTTPAETTKAPIDTPDDTTKAPVSDIVDDTTAVPGDDTTVAGDDTTVADDTTVEGDDTIVADDTTATPEDDTTAAEEETTKAPDTTKADDKADDEEASFPVVPVVIVAVVVVAAVVAGVIIAKKRK